MAQNARSRLLPILLVVMFMGPVLVAYGLNVFAPTWRPFGETNHGTLLQPVRKIEAAAISVEGRISADLFSDVWNLIYIAGQECDRTCQLTLVELRQLKIALGKDTNRLQQMLILETGAQQRYVTQATQDKTMVVGTRQPHWLTSVEIKNGNLLLVDPQGYAVMSYPPGTKAKDILLDLKRLLKISKIG